VGDQDTAALLDDNSVACFQTARTVAEKMTAGNFGKIVEEIGLDDGVTALQQLGLIKAS
jgi:hypothetical protein